jgi:hypothetical protein
MKIMTRKHENKAMDAASLRDALSQPLEVPLLHPDTVKELHALRRSLRGQVIALHQARVEVGRLTNQIESSAFGVHTALTPERVESHRRTIMDAQRLLPNAEAEVVRQERCLKSLIGEAQDVYDTNLPFRIVHDEYAAMLRLQAETGHPTVSPGQVLPRGSVIELNYLMGDRMAALRALNNQIAADFAIDTPPPPNADGRECWQPAPPPLDEVSKLRAEVAALHERLAQVEGGR